MEDGACVNPVIKKEYSADASKEFALARRRIVLKRGWLGGGGGGGGGVY